jgi:glycosyltransferase involved in cell wall biosynthesis
MPKILRILNRFNLGGPVYNAAYLSRFLAPDFETILVGGPKENGEGSSEDVVRSLGIEPIIIPEMRRALNPFNDIIAYRKILKIIDDFQPDIVHTHCSKAGALGRMAAKKKKVKVILHTFHGHVFHSYFNSVKTRIFINLERHLAQKTTRIIAISDKQKEELSGIYQIARPEKFSVIPLGLDLSQFRENRHVRRALFRARYSLEDDDIAIGIIGRLAPVKNHALFLKAIKKIQGKSSQKIRAFVIGDGELKSELIKLCHEIQLDYSVPVRNHTKRASVTFTSWIKPINSAYPGLDIVAMTSFNEGTPVCLIEAQACGVPIVTTNVGGIENVVVPFETALLARNNDIDNFSKKLLQLIEDPELRKRQAENGWQLVKHKFHYTRLVSDMERLYSVLLGELL